MHIDYGPPGAPYRRVWARELEAAGLERGRPPCEWPLSDRRERELEAQWPPAGSGDRVLNWIWVGLLLALLLFGSITPGPPPPETPDHGHTD